MATFRLFKWRLFATKIQKDGIRKDENMIRRQAKRRKDARRKDDKIKVFNSRLSEWLFSSFLADISSFRVAGLVFSHGVISSLRKAF